MRKAEKKANFSPRPQVGISVCYASSSSSLCKNSLVCMMAMALFSDHAGDIDLIETRFIFVSAFAPLASPRFVGPTLEASPFEGVSSGVGALLRPAPCLVGEATSTPIRPPDNWPFGPRFTHSVRWRRRMWLVGHILVIGARPLHYGLNKMWKKHIHEMCVQHSNYNRNRHNKKHISYCVEPQYSIHILQTGEGIYIYGKNPIS